MICIKCKKDVPDGLFCNLCGARQEPAQRAARRRGNGTGTVFKRGNYWYAQQTKYVYVETEDGHTKKLRRYVTKGGYRTKKEALEYLPELAQNKKREIPRLIDLWEQFKENSMPKLSDSTQTSYHIARRRLEAIIGRRIDELTTKDLQDVVNKNTMTYHPAHDMKKLLSHLYNIAMADQFVPSNLATHIVLPENEEKEAVPFNESEVEKMWKAYADGDLFVGYLLLMIYSGMMPGELSACRKDMIDFDRCEIWGCGKKTKKRKKEVPIVFAECVKPVLIELTETITGDRIQPNDKKTWYKKYHEAIARLGVRDLPPYSCRHTTGTEAAKQNLNASTIQKIMRHSKITTSQRYIHFGEAEAHAGINAINVKADLSAT